MTTRAAQIEVLTSPVIDPTTGSICSGYSVEFYAAGTSTAKNVWTEKEKTNPFTTYTLDSGGKSLLYGDGVYKIVIKNTDSTAVLTLDHQKIQATTFSVVQKSGAYTATPDDDVVLCDGTFTVALQAVANFEHPLTVKNIGSGTITIDPNGAETIDGESTYAIGYSDAAVQLFPDLVSSTWRLGYEIIPDGVTNGDAHDHSGGDGGQLVSSSINFTQSGVDAVERTVESKLQENPSLKDFDAAGDGTTDDRAAISNADTEAVGFIHVTPGSYKVATDLTLTANYVMDPGAVFVVPTGVTLTINGTIDAGLSRIFECAGTGKVVILWGAVHPEWWGAIADNEDASAALNTTAINEAAICAGASGTVLLSGGTYKVTATSPDYAVTFYGGVKGMSPLNSVIHNIGTGHAVACKGENDVGGTFYFVRLENFTVYGNASSGNGITNNPDGAIHRAVAYSLFSNVDSRYHGGHGLVHRYSWATKYHACKFNNNGGLGVSLYSGTTTEHNNIIFELCDSRWNGGTGDNVADLMKGGVKISGDAAGVYWLGGVVESNNCWGFIIGEDAVGVCQKVVIRNTYGEGHPSATFDSATGGFLRLSAKYVDVSVSGCTIAYGAPSGKTGYAFYVDGGPESSPGFKEWDNDVKPDLGAGTAVRDYGITSAQRWGSGTEIIDKQVNRDFSGTNNWVNDDIDAFDSTGDLTLVSTDSQGCHLPSANINNGAGMVYGKRYGITYDATASGIIHFASYSSITKIPNIVNGSGQAHEFTWLETNANQNLYIYTDGVAIANIDNIHIYEIGGGVQPQKLQHGLLSVSTVSFAADGDTVLYIVPTGKRAVLSHAIIVAGADAGGTTTISIGNEASTYANFIPTSTLSNLDAENDSVLLMPIPNATPLKIKSYAADAVIYAHVASQSGGAVNTLYLFGLIY